MRLQHRLSLTVTAVSAMVLVASFAAIYLLVRRDETRDFDEALLIQAIAAAKAAVREHPERPTAADGAGEVPEVAEPTPRYVAIYDPNGTLVSLTRSFGQAPPRYADVGLPATLPAEGQAVDIDGPREALRGVVVPFAGGRRLLYAVSRRSIDKDLVFLSRVFVFLFIGAMLATGLVARWLGAHLVRDVGALAATARAVAGGDLSARVAGRALSSTETRDLGADLDHMVAQLEMLMAAQQIFVSHAAHELRSPLATLRGQLQLTLRRPRPAEEYGHTLRAVLADVEQLVALAEDLLTLARVQRRPADSETTTVGEIIGDAVRLTRGPAESRGVRLREPGAADLDLAVRGARTDTARALRNLIDNAVAYSPPGSTVSIEVERAAGRVRIAVRDRGEGVSVEDAPHIFAPFYRGAKDQAGDLSGAGLGLAIAREIARAHGGDVILDATACPGARFLFELPVS